MKILDLVITVLLKSVRGLYNESVSGEGDFSTDSEATAYTEACYEPEFRDGSEFVKVCCTAEVI